jgi:hypothetical protein
MSFDVWPTWEIGKLATTDIERGARRPIFRDYALTMVIKVRLISGVRAVASTADRFVLSVLYLATASFSAVMLYNRGGSVSIWRLRSVCSHLLSVLKHFQ